MKTLRDYQEEDALIEAIVESNRIGCLVRKGRTVFYATLQPLSLGVMVEGASKVEVARKLLAISNA